MRDSQLRADVRAFLNAEVTSGRIKPLINSWLVGWDEDFSRRLAAEGWVGMTIPQAFGGGGANFRERFVVSEELLAAGAPVAAHWIAERQIAPSLLKYGTAEQCRTFLPGIAAGATYFAIGMSEPDAGSDLAGVRTKAIPRDGGWSLSGSKVWTSGAHRAHYFIVLARSSPIDGTSRHTGLSQFIVPLNSTGVDIRPIISMDGSHHFNEVFLDDVFVPDALVFGSVGSGWEQVTSELSFERSGPERFLSTLPLLAELSVDGEADIGRLAARISALHHVASHIADSLAQNANVTLEAAIAKVLGTETEGEIAEFAALTDLSRYPRASVIRAMTDAALLDRAGFTLRGGTNEVLRGVIARELGLR